MRKINLDNIDIGGTVFERLTAFTDKKGNVIVLPLLWSIHLGNTGLSYKWKTIGDGKRGINRRSHGVTENVKNEFVDQYISETTIKNYINNVFMYFKYLEDKPDKRLTPGPNNTEQVSGRSINHYINNVLPKRLDSVTSVEIHKAALMCYFNFLYFINIRECTEIQIHNQTMQLIHENRIKPRNISYICRKDRLLLLNQCKSKRNRAIIRLGYECGLRAKEIRGLLINDFKANNTNNKGLLSLFNELESKCDCNIFSYELPGKYTKGGKTRTIYFDRELLDSLKDYYETERNIILKNSGKKCDTLFVRSDKCSLGDPIGKSQASNIFRKIKTDIQHLSKGYRFHDLRHTFATELFHKELTHQNRNEINQDPTAALLEVAKRLGHKSIESSRRYIRMRKEMLSMEEMYE